MTGLPLIAQARADLVLVGWRLSVLLALAEQLLDVQQYRRVKVEAVMHLTGCGRATAHDALRTLTARGYLDRRGTGAASEYRLFWTRDVRSTEQDSPVPSPRPAA